MINPSKIQVVPTNEASILLSGLSWVKKQTYRHTEDRLMFRIRDRGESDRKNQAPRSIWLDTPDSSATFWCNIYTPSGILEFVIGLVIGLLLILSGVGSPWPEFGTASDLRDTLNVDDAVTWIRHWMARCRKQHARCINVDSVLPTRVVDVGLSDSDNISLYEASPGESAPYVALSYCWGGEGNLKTTGENRHAHNESIPWHSIPATVQDAIRLARHLEIRYIWIDALCIVQDNPNDWDAEARKMAEYYRGAYLVICATRSASTTHGIFGPRRPLEDGPTDFATRKTEIATENNGQVTFHSRDVPGHHRLVSPTVPHSDSNPLLFRAWAFQEQLLATQAVYFTAEEIAWECREAVWCECGNRWAAPDLSDFDQVLRRGSYPKPDQFWRRLVMQYSQRSLTFVIDKLAAFEGIARQFQNLDLGHYYYGIWEASLLTDLGWSAYLTEHTTCSLKDGNGDVIIGPSWSWLATNYQVAFGFDWHTADPDVNIQHLAKIQHLPKVSPTLDLRKAIICPPPSWDIWSLTLDAKVIEAHVRIMKRNRKDESYSLFIPSNDNVQPSLEGRFRPDVDLDDSAARLSSAMARWKWVNEHDTVKCVLLRTAEPFYWKAIVVKQALENPKLHIRVGLAHNMDDGPETFIWHTTANSRITLI
ncbi:hypothetical protein AbraIFM66951_005082 [Aspergillus brasiliensis]|uniref:Heterokaryon incompatibility domain-containing protein n=1 Tax=Aspergillus brasiliensis TaxID=319629 RepID=A0A9W5Z0A2_9EURO|nr:hypothetical protein AbraCBS73388_001997 [Aspergillus brasiliensis]GKZ51146.1 hypothetical protein AbraIFM66951_005082 [Aspergillus brasiliensis]